LKPISVPVLIPSAPSAEEIFPLLKEIDTNKWYSNNGPLNKRLISLFSNYTSIDEPNIVTSANATLALEGAIETSNLEDSYLELPSWTFAATAHAAVRSGFNKKFVDVGADWRSIPTADSNLLIDVLPFGDSMRVQGYPSNLKSVVIDAAASFSNLQDIRFLSNVPQAIIISLHSTKLIGAGEGAIFISNDAEWAERFRQWTSFGFDGNRTAQSDGTNAKLSEYAAAIGVASFEHWQKIQRSYDELTSWANSTSIRLGLETHPAMSKGLISPYWIVKFADEHSKLSVSQYLLKNGIQTRNWWEAGCHKMPAFSQIEFDNLSKTEELASRTLGLPFHLFMTDKVKNYVARNLEDSLAKISSK
jgi:dTDP-4-amino-4,6-dideoxygalactose transaminase